MKVATECFRDPDTRKYLIAQIGTAVKSEVRAMCSDKANSDLRSQSQDDLKTFTWSRLLAELSVHAPILYSILRAATSVKRARPNTDAVIGTCVAIILKHRFSKMSLFQNILSLVIYSGHPSKQVSREFYIQQFITKLRCTLFTGVYQIAGIGSLHVS